MTVQGSTTCRLYATTPPGLVSGGVSVSVFAEQLRAAIAATDIACLRIAGSDAERVAVIGSVLLPLAQGAGVAVLLDDPALAVKLRADGVHLEDAGGYRDARRLLGGNAIVGITCPLERHAAMIAAEEGADYVQFAFDAATLDEALVLVAWWTELMTTPSVACGDFATDPAGRNIASAFIAIGTDFLAPPAGVWSDPDPAKALADLLRGA